MTVTTLSTDQVQPGEREDFWRHLLSDTFAPVSIQAMADGAEDDGAGTIRANWIGRLMVADVRSTGQEVRRTPRLIRGGDNAYFQISIVTEGIARVDQDDRQAVLRPGDFAVYETTRPFQWRFDDRWAAWGFTMPGGSIPLTERERRLLTARRLDGSTGLTGIVSRFLLDVARHGDSLHGEQAERVLANISDLVVILLSGGLSDRAAVRDSAQRTFVLRVKDHIDQRLSDPALGPAEIAAAFHVSPRYLHKLFEAEPRTVSQYIKGRRLEQARRDLLDPRLHGRSVSAIAQRCGFGDLSGFNRSFKQAYGASPRELRDARTPPRARSGAVRPNPAP